MASFVRRAEDIMLLVFFAGGLLGMLYELFRFCCNRLSADQRVGQEPTTPPPPPPPLVLPCFPYEPPATEGGGRASESTAALCAICLDDLRMGQMCSEVPACRHVFHRECLAAWATDKGSCPLCRAIIVHAAPDQVAPADDMV